jgi:hypothetical protein
MKFRLALAALALAATPSFAAGLCGDRTHVTAAACGEGQVFDAASGTCILKPMS